MPSFVGDFVHIFSWVNQEGEEYFISNSAHGICFWVYRIGNWRVTQAKNDKIYWEVAYISMKLFWDIIFSVVSQAYVSGAHEVYVIVGNSALVKCEIPSFVSDFVSVVSWVDNEGNEFFSSKNGIFINKIFKIFWWWDTHEFLKLFFYFFFIT